MDLLQRLLNLRAGEWRPVLLSGMYFFAVLAALMLLRPARDALGMQRGMDEIRWLFFGTAAVTLLVQPLFGWLRSTDLVTVEPWMERALRERMHPFAPEGRRNFFFQTNHRDPLPLWTHLWHWWDNARIREQPHPSPIRRTPLLYNVWMSRAEGTATVMEEYMMHAGLYDQSPRSREIVWIMLMNRAARGLGNLYAHSNELTMQQAGDIHVNWTPRGWMRRDPLLGFEQHLYLRQPGYGPAYVTGGRLVDEIIAERARQLGPQFSMRRFYDEFTRAGMIPVSLIYWELTGDDRMVRELEDGVTLRPFR